VGRFTHSTTVQSEAPKHPDKQSATLVPLVDELW